VGLRRVDGEIKECPTELAVRDCTYEDAVRSHDMRFILDADASAGVSVAY